MEESEFPFYLCSIVMPCLNEEETLAFCIEEAQNFLKDFNVHGEIIIADNGSIDHSKYIALKYGCKVVEINKKGYGNALRKGIASANGKYIIMGDCDGSYDFYHLDRFLEKLEEGYDLVMGNRLSKEILMEKGAMPFSHQYLGVPILSWLARKRYHSTIHDFHCGIRGFTKASIDTLELQGQGMEFASEMIGAYEKKNMKIAEIAVHFRKDKRNKKSHIRPIRDGLRHIMEIIKG